MSKLFESVLGGRPDRGTAMEDQEFHDNVLDAYYSSKTDADPNTSDEDFEEDLEAFIDDNWDELLDRYWV
jgi:hypothetical protein